MNKLDTLFIILTSAVEKGLTEDQVNNRLKRNRIPVSPEIMEYVYQSFTMFHYSINRYQGQILSVKYRPYWQYLCVADNDTDKKHLQLKNKIFLWNDQIWDSIYPPNSFYCRCTVRSISKMEFESENLKLSYGSNYIEEQYIETGWKFNPGKTDPNFIKDLLIWKFPILTEL